MPWHQVTTNPGPDGAAQVTRCLNRVDAEQTDGAQYERHHRRVQFMPRGKPDTRDIATVVRRARQPREVVPTKIVDCAGPQCLFERALAEINFVAQYDLPSTDRFQVRFLVS